MQFAQSEIKTFGDFTSDEIQHLQSRIASPNVRIIIGQALISELKDQGIGVAAIPKAEDEHGLLLKGAVPAREVIQVYADFLRYLGIYTVYIDRSIVLPDFKIIDITPNQEV